MEDTAMIWRIRDSSNGCRSMCCLRLMGSVSPGKLISETLCLCLIHFLCSGRISSYINNVHPTQHPDFYKAIEGLIDIFIPTFNRVIIDLKDPGYFNQRIHLVEFGRDPFIKREPDNFRPPEQRAWGNFLDNDGHFHISMFVDLKKEFWNTGLQMVLHLQDIELSPDNPMFGGEEFHVQGQTVLPLYSIQSAFVLT